MAFPMRGDQGHSFDSVLMELGEKVDLTHTYLGMLQWSTFQEREKS